MALLNKLGEIVKSAAEKTEELTKTLEIGRAHV